MSINDQQERFCQSYILHRNASEAARAAGYAKEHAARQGHRLLQNEEIVERIEDLEKELSTEVDVVPEIENQYTYAKANGHTNSAIKALELLSRVRGAKTNKDIDLDPEKLEETTVDYMKVLGKDIVMKMVKKAGFI